VISRSWNRLAILGGAVALVILGTTPVAAATDTCPQGTSAIFTGTNAYLGQEGETNIWSTTVTLYAYCGTTDADHALSNVVVSGVYATSSGTIPDLEASADGSIPSVVLPLQMMPGMPFPYSPLPTPPGLITDSTGKVQFTLRAQSPTHPFLAGPDGAPQVIGMQLELGTGSASGSGDPLQYHVGGFGDIVASTPELDSLALFGSGAMGLAGYAVLRLRARRRS
jgi:hypothetical protein